MFEEQKLLNDQKTVQAIQEQLNLTKAEKIFAHSQRLLGKRLPSEMYLEESVHEAIAQQLILLGVRGEFLYSCLPIKASKLKNIQRSLKRKGLLDGVMHTKRLLQSEERSVRWFLSKGRIVATLFLSLYELLTQKQSHKRINLYFFVLAYLLTKEIFEHPQIAQLEMPELSTDMAYYFCHLATEDRVQTVRCPTCGHFYRTFSFERNLLNSPKCPYCHALSIANLECLKLNSEVDYL